MNLGILPTESHSLFANKCIRDENPLNAVHVGRPSAAKSYLVVYQETHAEEKLYKCDRCGKDFSSKSYLIAH